ncbi:MAG: AMP-binding protein, partial [Pseudomonadota bacterium]
MALRHDFADFPRDWRDPAAFPSPPKDFNFAFDILDDRAAHADKTALIALDGDGGNLRDVSFSALSAASTRFGEALMRLGLAKGDYAVLIAGRVPEWHEAFFGCLKAGVIATPGTNLLTAKDIAQRIQRAGARAAIVSAAHAAKIDAIRADCPTLEHCIVIGDVREGWLSYAALRDAEDGASPRDAFPSTAATDEMMTYFTSGTTAQPKMVPRDHAYAWAHALSGLYWMDLAESDRHWAITDTGWAKAAWGLLFPQFMLGAAVVLHDSPGGFDGPLFLRMIEEAKVTTFCAPPTIYRLFGQVEMEGYDLSSLRRCISAGEPLNPEAMRYWRDHTGTTIAEGYGQTETIAVAGNFPGLPSRPGSMGKPTPGFDVDAVDDDGNRCAVGDIGHLAIRTEGAAAPGLFPGYRKDDGLDRSAFRNGWYYSGDTIWRDEDGYLWFVGRSDDVISSAGYRISPFEVESALLEHPAVVESAVVGIADEERGQLVKAFVVLAAGFESGEALTAEIQDFCKAETAPYKYPRVIEYMDALPKTVSGKIR